MENKIVTCPVCNATGEMRVLPNHIKYPCASVKMLRDGTFIQSRFCKENEPVTEVEI